MSSVDRDDCTLLTSEEKADGFSIHADNRQNITLLRWGKPVAWFSARITREVLIGFLGLIKAERVWVEREHRLRGLGLS
jgi:hypothetical protein